MPNFEANSEGRYPWSTRFNMLKKKHRISHPTRNESSKTEGEKKQQTVGLPQLGHTPTFPQRGYPNSGIPRNFPPRKMLQCIHRRQHWLPSLEAYLEFPLVCFHNMQRQYLGFRNRPKVKDSRFVGGPNTKKYLGF